MLVTEPAAFLEALGHLPDAPWGPAVPRAALLLSPDGLDPAAATCADNAYMRPADAVDADRCAAEHRALARALSAQLPVLTFPGDPATPDAVFLNNAFATVPGHLLLGAMRYPARQRETARADIRAFFSQVLGYATIDLARGDRVAELTGSLVIDRRRGVGLCGLSERCDLAGAQAMHAAFGLRLSFAFDLAPGEYHTNVVLSVLAGRSLVMAPSGLADAAVAEALATAWRDRCVELSAAEQGAFAGNCIALREGSVWMSEGARAALRPGTRAAFAAEGWTIDSVPLPEIEKAGGSLRCCVAELF
ncbi:MAG: arginine deiminase-related protein [Pseudoxanthomonas sp.]|nr:arginine deiminase-related protein [Pseudoxanthomonas sp.]